ncbi:LPD25 domain-containing protein [Marinomonas flavescens]|uniref:LPD25 domain-containing protein n=1 Tax=Marinomonas flavescens TaxID=2529379 RepID=UPI001A9D21E0|nr:LPD25 domain-containing protein [Marinomonas flavescens]
MKNTHNNSLNTMITPVSVSVHWSESGLFKSMVTYDFVTFESMAFEAAVSNLAGGYDKTRITVNLSDHSQYECRLDLGVGDNELGFADHCISIIEFNQRRLADNCTTLNNLNDQYISMIRTITKYEFDKSAVFDARTRMKEICEHNKKLQHQRDEALLESKKNIEAIKRADEKQFQDSLMIPQWAKSVIIATHTEYDEINSDPYADYYRSKTTRTIILAWSKHTRMLFSELRKACGNHSDLKFLADKNQSKEHRQNYSMGNGYFLTDKDFIREGWIVKKHIFSDSKNKASQVPLGELVAH